MLFLFRYTTMAEHGMSSRGTSSKPRPEQLTVPLFSLHFVIFPVEQSADAPLKATTVTRAETMRREDIAVMLIVGGIRYPIFYILFHS